MCIIMPASNMYEQPRPPRRGSHRPEGGAAPRTGPADEAPSVPLLPRQASLPSPVPTPARMPPMAPTIQPSATLAPPPFAQRLPIKTENKMAWMMHPSSPYVQDQPIQPLPLPPPLLSEAQRPAYLPTTPPETAQRVTATPLPQPRTELSVAMRSSLDLLRLMNGKCNRLALERSIWESYARSSPQSAACQSLQKRCMFPSCTKISVSRGLCRGHGGGRRCHVADCTKSAQSRSNACWAHGGGRRCDVENCMRSRKSKRFCVAHLHYEANTSSAPTSSKDAPMPASRSARSSRMRKAQLPQRCLPSLGQALSSASRSPPNLPARSHQPRMCAGQ